MDETLARALDFVQQMKQTPIGVNDALGSLITGFIGALEPKCWNVFCETIARPDMIAKGWSRRKEGQSARTHIFALRGQSVV